MTDNRNLEGISIPNPHNRYGGLGSQPFGDNSYHQSARQEHSSHNITTDNSGNYRAGTSTTHINVSTVRQPSSCNTNLIESACTRTDPQHGHNPLPTSYFFAQHFPSRVSQDTRTGTIFNHVQ